MYALKRLEQQMFQPFLCGYDMAYREAWCLFSRHCVYLLKNIHHMVHTRPCVNIYEKKRVTECLV